MNFYEKIRDEFLSPAGLINKNLIFGCKVIITRSIYQLSEEQKEYLSDKHWKCILSDEIEENEEWYLYTIEEEDLALKNTSTYEWECISWLDMFRQVRVKSEWHTEQTISTIRNRTIYERWKPAVRFEDYSYVFQEVSSILGHPYDLREVMRWFANKGNWHIDNRWALCTYTDYILDSKLDIDLSKPLQEQNLKHLYNLMKSLNQ